MCKSIAEGGRRCRCKTAKAAADKRDAAAKRQARYMKKKRAERAAATVDVDTERSPEVTPEAKHAEAVKRLTDYLTAIREQETAEHAAAVTLAAERVKDIPNPFEGITVTPTADPITVDEAYSTHLAREAAEERRREEQEMRDAAPKPERARVEANFLSFMDELRGVTST